MYINSPTVSPVLRRQLARALALPIGLSDPAAAPRRRSSTRAPPSRQTELDMTTDMDIDFTRRNKKPRPLSEHEKEKLDEFVDAIHYSARLAIPP